MLSVVIVVEFDEEPSVKCSVMICSALICV